LAAYGLQANSPERGGPIILTLGGPRRNASPVSPLYPLTGCHVPQRSPLILVLLAAATLALDAVAITWLARAGVLSAASFLYDALLSAQLALVCLWAVLDAKSPVSGWGAVIIAVLIASSTTVHISTVFSFAEEAGSNGVYVSLLSAALWILKRTAVWRRLTGSGPIVWQYSIGVLLATMTLVAVLVVLLRGTQLVSSGDETWKLLFTLMLGDVLMTIAITVLWALGRRFIYRLTPVCVLANLLAGIEAGLTYWIFAGSNGGIGDQDPTQYLAYRLIFSAVVFLWLELTPIIPISRHAKSAATDAKE
jgi:hypothetical protein